MQQGSIDTALFERSPAGDAVAIESLIERLASRVYRVAHGITGNAADAEHVAQDVFLTLLRPVSGVGDRVTLARVYRLTIDLASSTRGPLDHPIEEVLPTYGPEGHRQGKRAFLLADWSRLPDGTLLSDEGRRAVRAAVRRLPVRDAAALILRDLEALSNADVSEVLGEPVAAVKARLHRARMALREQFTRAHASRGALDT